MSSPTSVRRGLTRRLLASRLVDTLTTPHTVDHYLEQIDPMLAVHHVRAEVVDVYAETPSASTVVLRPNDAWRGARAGQHIQFGVEVEGRRRTRCFSVSTSELIPDGLISVSVKAHPDGYVSQFLKEGLTPGTTIFLSPAEGDFTLPSPAPAGVVLISGGSGITPVMSMLRTLRDRGHREPLTFLHYARSRADEMFSADLDELAAACPWARIERVYTREPDPRATLEGRFARAHLDALGIDPTQQLTYACGPAGLIDAVSDTYAEADAEDNLRVEWFKVPTVDLDAADATGALVFDETGREVANDGSTILEQAEGAGLTPEFGCRMGICHTCTLTKKHGAVRNVINGEISADTDEQIQICVNAPVGDVCVAL